MTVEEAVKILNRNNHLGSSRWFLSKDGSACAQYLTNYEGVRGPFEAIAIAEAYLKKEKEGPLSSVREHFQDIEKKIEHLQYLHNILEKRIRYCERTDYDKGLIGTTQTATGTQYHTIPEMIKAVEAKVDKVDASVNLLGAGMVPRWGKQ